jgi:ferrous iron transport protein B
MNSQIIHVHPAGQLIALVGHPNCGKSALFNRLTGSRQKVANYAGVTIERKEGRVDIAGRKVRLLDLPGAYSLHPRSPDEAVTVDILMGRARGERQPDGIICVVDTNHLERNLRLVLAVQRLGLPMVVALNRMDVVHARGLAIDVDALARELGVPVVPCVAVAHGGTDALLSTLADTKWQTHRKQAGPDFAAAVATPVQTPAADHAAVRAVLSRVGWQPSATVSLSDRIDDYVLHPVLGPALLLFILFLVFQAVFAWAQWPMEIIKSGTAGLTTAITTYLPDNWWRSLLAEGIVSGLGGVLVFLPQIMILFMFILALEESGYLPRAAFLLDRLMGGVGLSGRSFIPLLSSFACAIPGIMATRTISEPRDRLVTILIAPLMTCSARLPVYALLIGAFVPIQTVWIGIQLQGLVLLGLYLAGIVAAMGVAWVLRFAGTRHAQRPLMMELPDYHRPRLKNILTGLSHRVVIFVKRVGGIILGLTVLLWFLASYPVPPVGATGSAIEYSLAGTLGRALAVIFEPIGFNWQISIALVPGLAAREVAVSALATVYAVGGEAAVVDALTPVIAGNWSFATALSLLTWYVFAPMCLSTFATMKRETGGYRIPLAAAAYLFALAYLASFIVYRSVLALS